MAARIWRTRPSTERSAAGVDTTAGHCLALSLCAAVALQPTVTADPHQATLAMAKLSAEHS
jgi:hypothetical protein